MLGKSQFDRLLFQVAEARRQAGAGGARNGYVKEIKEAGGERKMRVVMGIKPDGSELLSPWLHADDHSGGGREQQMYEKGQNVTVNPQGGADFRTANVSPGPQSKSFPQPDHASKINGDSYQAGKMRRSVNKPGEQQSSGSSGAGGSGGSGGGSDNKGGEHHFHDVWIAKEDNKKPQHQDQPSAPMGQSSGGGSSTGGQQGGQQQQGKDEAAMRSIVHEKDGIQHIVGKDHRVVAHEKGSKLKSGDENWCVASKEEKKVIVCSEEPPWVSQAWIIKKKKDPIPDYSDSSGSASA